jgi:hypothetical protein
MPILGRDFIQNNLTTKDTKNTKAKRRFLERIHKSYSDFSLKNVKETRLGGKAVEGHRSPRRFALTQAITFRASVLDCASPLALWSGQSNVRPCRMMRYVFCRNALILPFRGGWIFCGLQKKRQSRDGDCRWVNQKIISGADP